MSTAFLQIFDKSSYHRGPILQISEVHQSLLQWHQEATVKMEKMMEDTKNWLDPFDEVRLKNRQREKSRLIYDHYMSKLDNLRSSVAKKKARNSTYVETTKESERIMRVHFTQNQRKLATATENFRKDTNDSTQSLLKAMESRYVNVTPCLASVRYIQLIAVEVELYKKAASVLSTLKSAPEQLIQATHARDEEGAEDQYEDKKQQLDNEAARSSHTQSVSQVAKQFDFDSSEEEDGGGFLSKPLPQKKFEESPAPKEFATQPSYIAKEPYPATQPDKNYQKQTGKRNPAWDVPENPGFEDFSFQQKKQQWPETGQDFPEWQQTPLYPHLEKPTSAGFDDAGFDSFGTQRRPFANPKSSESPPQFPMRTDDFRAENSKPSPDSDSSDEYEQFPREERKAGQRGVTTTEAASFDFSTPHGFDGAFSMQEPRLGNYSGTGGNSPPRMGGQGFPMQGGYLPDEMQGGLQAQGMMLGGVPGQFSMQGGLPPQAGVGLGLPNQGNPQGNPPGAQVLGGPGQPGAPPMDYQTMMQIMQKQMFDYQNMMARQSDPNDPFREADAGVGIIPQPPKGQNNPFVAPSDKKPSPFGDLL